VEFLRTERDAQGLFSLENMPMFQPAGAALRKAAAASGGPGTGPAGPRRAFSRFWQAWFGALFRRLPPENPRQAWEHAALKHPEAAVAFGQGLSALARTMSETVRSGAASVFRDPDFWREVPAPVRPLSGYLQMYVQNEPSRSSLLRAVSLVEQLRAETGEWGGV
jgi:hypothetical protein